MTLSNHPYCEDCTTRPACKRMGCINVPAPSPAAPQAAAQEPAEAEDDDLDPRMALDYARRMKAYVEAFADRDWASVSLFGSVDEKNLAGALDNLTECAAMLMNTAERLLAAAPSVPLQPPLQTDKQPDSGSGHLTNALAEGSTGQPIYLVATGWTIEGRETYTRHEGAPPPMCDFEGPLFAAAPSKDATEGARSNEHSAVSSPLAAVQSEPAAVPVDMVLYCPNCGLQHVDEPESHRVMVEGVHVDDAVLWDNPPHRSHLCHECGCIWRPADVLTNGVSELKTEGKADTWPNGIEDVKAQRATHPAAVSAEPREATLADAPKVLNINDRAMWVLGWNECVAAMAGKPAGDASHE